jgi:hypothetical protein
MLSTYLSFYQQRRLVFFEFKIAGRLAVRTDTLICAG